MRLPRNGRRSSHNFPLPSQISRKQRNVSALGRSTASVFHLMRCMEIALRSIARCLEIPDPIRPAERNWGAILRELKKAMDERSAGGKWTKDDLQFFENAYVSVDAVRNSWRNPTMHVERTYTEEDADVMPRASAATRLASLSYPLTVTAMAGECPGRCRAHSSRTACSSLALPGVRWKSKDGRRIGPEVDFGRGRPCYASSPGPDSAALLRTAVET